MPDRKTISKADDDIDVPTADLETDAHKEKMKLRDWITLSISILAFLISATSAYWNVFRQVDDLRVVIEGTPDMWLNIQEGKINVTAYGRFHFTNLGNRPITVSQIYLTVGQPASLKKDMCSSDAPVALLPFRMTPFLVKSGDITSEVIPLYGDPISFAVSDGNRGKEKLLISPCLRLDFITADNGWKRISVPIFDTLQEIGKGKTVGLGQMSDKARSLQIYHKWATIFSD